MLSTLWVSSSSFIIIVRYKSLTMILVIVIACYSYERSFRIGSLRPKTFILNASAVSFGLGDPSVASEWSYESVIRSFDD